MARSEAARLTSVLPARIVAGVLDELVGGVAYVLLDRRLPTRQ